MIAYALAFNSSNLEVEACGLGGFMAIMVYRVSTEMP